ERLGRCDPHSHTTYSDGLGTPHAVVEAALALGLDVIAITDHDSVQGALEARELVARAGYPIDVIVGTEVTTARGVHLLALFVEERLPMLRPAARTIEESARFSTIATIAARRASTGTLRTLARAAVVRLAVIAAALLV